MGARWIGSTRISRLILTRVGFVPRGAVPPGAFFLVSGGFVMDSGVDWGLCVASVDGPVALVDLVPVLVERFRGFGLEDGVCLERALVFARVLSGGV